MSVMEEIARRPAAVHLASQSSRAGVRSRGRTLFERIYIVYMFMLMLLPTGSLFGLNVKIICFALLFLLAVGQVQQRNFRALVFLYSPLLFIPWILLGEINGFPVQFPLLQYKDLVSMLLTCWVTLVYCRDTDGYRLKCVKWIVEAEVAASAFKTLIVLYSTVTGAPFTDITGRIDQIFKIQLTVFGGETFLGRISFPSDILIPVCLFAVIAYRVPLQIGKLRAGIYLGLMLTSLVYSFSRYSWFFGVVAVVLSLFLSSKKDRFKTYIVCGLLISGIGLRTTLTNIVHERFNDDLVSASDSFRERQIPQLEHLFSTSPFIGAGLGSYVAEFGSDRGTTPYSYEVEWLALAAQLGIFGVIVLLALGFIYFRGLLYPQKKLRRRLVLSAVLLLWALGGFTNPSVIESVSAAAYSILMALADLRLEV